MKATQGSSNHLAAAQIATISLIMNWTGGTGRLIVAAWSDAGIHKYTFNSPPA